MSLVGRPRKPRTAASQKPACTHKDHHVLYTAEATSFARQLWDRKVQATKASQHEFLASCIDIDLERNGVPALVEGGNNEDDSDSE